MISDSKYVVNDVNYKWKSHKMFPKTVTYVEQVVARISKLSQYSLLTMVVGERWNGRNVPNWFGIFTNLSVWNQIPNSEND